MQRVHTPLFFVCLSFLSLLAACAGLQPQVMVSPEKGEKLLAIKADSFKFEPNNIRAYGEDVIVLQLENVSRAKHNFTIRDPQGHIVQSVDLPPQKTVEIKVPLSEIGIYNFYCDRPFHPFFGMKGQIEVLKR